MHIEQERLMVIFFSARASYYLRLRNLTKAQELVNIGWKHLEKLVDLCLITGELNIYEEFEGLRQIQDCIKTELLTHW